MKLTQRILQGRYNNERGAILVWLTLAGVLILTFLAFAFDGGFFYQHKRRMQTAADSAALAAALEKKRNADSTISDMVTIGRQDAGTNGFTHGASNIGVDIVTPPDTGNYASQPGYVQATITQHHPTFFASLFNLLTPPGNPAFNQTTVRARAVAGPASSNCIYVLDETASNAFEITSGSGLNAPNCGVQVNSSASSALSLSSASNLTAMDVNVHGNYQASGSTVTPTPDTGEARIPDPLSWLQPPATTPCTFNNVTIDLPQATSTQTIQPGVYCGGIEIKKGRVTMAAGNYVMVGNAASGRGGLVVGGSDSRLDGSGVSIYNHVSPCASIGPEKCRIYVKSGATMNISAPDNGTYAGIAIFQQRHTFSSNNDKAEVRFESNSHVAIHGTVYVPNHEYVHHSNTVGLSAAPWTAVVARTMEISSGSNLTVNVNPSAVPNPLRRIALVE